MSINVREFLNSGWPYREISIKYHAFGVQVSIRHDYEEVVSCVNTDIPEAIQYCIDNFDEKMKHKTAEKVKRLERKKKEIEKELLEVSSEISSIKLNSFKVAK